VKDTVTVPRWVAKTLARQQFAFTDEAATALEELRIAAGEEIPWSNVVALIHQFEDETSSPHIRGQLDQLQQYATNRLRMLEVDVRDPRVLYEAICVLGLIAEAARNGRDNGVIAADTATEMQSVCRMLGASLGRYAPDEART